LAQELVSFYCHLLLYFENLAYTFLIQGQTWMSNLLEKDRPA